MLQPSHLGAFARAVATACLLSIAACFAFAGLSQAHASTRHHHHHHRHHARHAHYRHVGHAKRHSSQRIVRIVGHPRIRVTLEAFSDKIAAQVPKTPFDALAAVFGPAQRVYNAAANDLTVFAHASIRGFDSVVAQAKAIGVPVAIGVAVARQESGGRCRIRSWDGGRGIMQVMPQTARAMGFDPARLYDCDYGAKVGMHFLKACLDSQGRYGLVVALSCYNHGIGRVWASRYGYQVAALIRRGTSRLITAHFPAPHLHHHHRQRWALL